MNIILRSLFLRSMGCYEHTIVLAMAQIVGERWYTTKLCTSLRSGERQRRPCVVVHLTDSTSMANSTLAQLTDRQRLENVMEKSRKQRENRAVDMSTWAE